MTTYRAAYLNFPQSAGVVLTQPEHAGLDDAALRAEALAEAHRAGMIAAEPDDAGRITEEQFADLLQIGDWKE